MMELPTKITVGNREYEIISFSSRITNKSIQVRGIGLAQCYLAVVSGYRIYNTKSGKPLIRGRFEKMETALKFATWMEKAYWDWFVIWDSYPEANLPSWLKYTVKDGARLYEMVEYLSTLETITDKDIVRAIEISKEQAKKWTC